MKKFAIKFEGFSNFISIFFKKYKSLLALNCIITFLKWLATSFTVYVLLLAHNQEISLLYVFLLNSMLIIVSLVPISIAGLGTRELASVFLFSYVNVDASTILSTYIIVLIVTYLLALIFLLIGLKEINLNFLKNKGDSRINVKS